MHKKSKVSKSFLVEIENFLYQSAPVRSTGIQVDLGKEEPSSWVLEISHGAIEETRGLVASLFCIDGLKVEFDIELSLIISDVGLKEYKVSGSVNGHCTEAKQDKACLVLENFVNDEELSKTEQFSNGTISISCELELYYSNSVQENNSHLNNESFQDKCLTFGPVEELHYIKVYPKTPFLTDLSNQRGHCLKISQQT
eukprot:TRINITY_DN12201_c0_g1_i2.p1 TRINITY_DN12201_c0_g1~~TRINITY_DN12201_c0_g1_i2.p1  ORF type:complete len:198 (-),score=31.72 TRINITY_DN12201_c0_g1_i2:80-673(-)